MGKTKVPSGVQKDKDESIVFFRELYKHQEDTDVNLLEPMYSVEFDAIQGGHMTKLPPAVKRDFLIPINEKHDYDWLKTPPAASLFPPLETKTNSSEMVLEKELPIPRHVKPSASRFASKPEATKTSAKPSSPPSGSSSKNVFRGAPSISNEKNHPHAIDKRSTYYSALTGRQQKPDATTAKATTAGSNTTKKHSDRCHGSQGSSAGAAKTITMIPAEEPYKAPKNLLTTGSIFSRRAPSMTTTAKTRPGGPALGVDAKGESGRARRLPLATTIGFKELHVDGKKNALPGKGKAVAATTIEPDVYNGGAGEPASVKGVRRTDGKNERRPRFTTDRKSVV